MSSTVGTVSDPATVANTIIWYLSGAGRSSR